MPTFYKPNILKHNFFFKGKIISIFYQRVKSYILQVLHRYIYILQINRHHLYLKQKSQTFLLIKKTWWQHVTY